jgi:hypothetical protein
VTARTDYVVGMTPDERIAALVYLGERHPAVFDEIIKDTEHQRRIRAARAGDDDDRRAPYLP